jgi:hypothetical protein
MAEPGVTAHLRGKIAAALADEAKTKLVTRRTSSRWT